MKTSRMSYDLYGREGERFSKRLRDNGTSVLAVVDIRLGPRTEKGRK
jgi:hypothetical protein